MPSISKIDDRHRPQRSAGGGDLLLHEHREVPLVVEAGRGVERVLALLADAASPPSGRARLRRRGGCVSSASTALIDASSRLTRRISSSAWAEAVLALAGAGAERDAGGRGEHAGGARDDTEHGGVRGDADDAGGERGDAGADGNEEAGVLHSGSHRRVAALA